MGIIWDLIQQGQIGEAADKAQSLESRVHALEVEVRKTNAALMDLLKVLETRFGEDLDSDGVIG